MKRYQLASGTLMGVVEHPEGSFVHWDDYERLKGERDEQGRHACTLFDECKRLRQELSLAEEGLANYAQEVERLLAALQKYGSHGPECDAGFDLSDHCTCGYSDALRGCVPQTREQT